MSFIEQLQKEYIASFPEKISALQAALEKKDVANLKNQLHRLAGSGKTYSFPEITELARAGELHLDQFGVDTELANKITSLVRLLSQLR